MTNMTKISPKDLEQSVIDLIGGEWMLLGAGSTEANNSMTISWGTMGFMFNRNVVSVMVRPERHTFTFIEAEDKFSLTVLVDGKRDALVKMGKLSGRNCDKAKEAGLTPAFTESGLPTFEEARIVFECKKLYAQQMTEDCFLDKSLVDAWYDEAHGNFHKMYIAEIEACWIKK